MLVVMLRVVLCLIAVFPLAACASSSMPASERTVNGVVLSERTMLAGNAYDAALARCDAQFPQQRAQAVLRQKCKNEAMNVHMMDGTRHPDLMTRRAATELVIAEKFQAGRISEAQATLEYSEAHTAMMTEFRKRELNERSVSAQEMEANRSVVCTTARPTILGTTTTCN